MTHKYCAESDTVLIRPLKKEDLEYLRTWRNDEKISTYLRSIPFITEKAQTEWFDKYLKDDDSLFFSVIDKERGIIVGSLALYSFTDNKCEIGKIVIGDHNSHGKGIGYNSILLAISVAIKKLQKKKIVLDVHEDNLPARKIYDKVGFSVVGRHLFEKGGFELEMKINSNHFYEVNPLAENVNIYLEENRDGT